MVQNENSELQCRTELAALREELLAATPIERVSGLASLSADANSSVLNPMPPASPFAFTFRAPQLELSLFSDNSQNNFAFNEFILFFNNALQATPNMTSQKCIFLPSLLCGRTLPLLQQYDYTENGDRFSILGRGTANWLYHSSPGACPVYIMCCGLTVVTSPQFESLII